MSLLPRVSTRPARSLACAFALLSLTCAPAVLSARTQPPTASAAASTNSIFFSPVDASFGNVGIGSTSQPISVTITNGTSSAARFVSASNLSTFQISTGTCGPIRTSAGLAPGASCTFSATFTPTTAGTVVGTLTFQAGSLVATFHLTGTGFPPFLKFTPSSVDFGNVAVGTNSAPVTIGISNHSGATATFASATPNLTDFLFQGGTCGLPNRTQTIPDSTDCTFSVQFTPTTPGVVNGSFTLNTGVGPVTFTLSGTGR